MRDGGCRCALLPSALLGSSCEQGACRAPVLPLLGLGSAQLTERLLAGNILLTNALPRDQCLFSDAFRRLQSMWKAFENFEM